MSKQIVLLDLNSTLAEKYGYDPKTYSYQVDKDVYSKELVKLISDKDKFEVHLITARPDKYKQETLAKIEEQVGLDFLDCTIFKINKGAWVKVHDFKANYLKTILKQGAKLENIVAIESNRSTKNEYSKLGLTEMYTRAEYINKYGGQQR